MAANIYKEFQDGFAKYVNGGKVSASDFLQYYYDQNSTLPNEKDTYFIEAVSKTWGLPCEDSEPLHYQAHKSGQIADVEDVIFEKIRQRTHKTEDEGKTVKHFFKHYDVKGQGTLTKAQFT